MAYGWYRVEYREKDDEGDHTIVASNVRAFNCRSAALKLMNAEGKKLENITHERVSGDTIGQFFTEENRYFIAYLLRKEVGQ